MVRERCPQCPLERREKLAGKRGDFYLPVRKEKAGNQSDRGSK
jgi:hypothetical protein